MRLYRAHRNDDASTANKTFRTQRIPKPRPVHKEEGKENERNPNFHLLHFCEEEIFYEDFINCHFVVSRVLIYL